MVRKSNQLSNSAEVADNRNFMAELANAFVSSPQCDEMIKSGDIKSVDDLLGKDGLVAQMIKPLLSKLLEAEMTEHLGYEKHDSQGYNTGNSRNGSYIRKLRSSDGKFDIEMPRDRESTFKSKVIAPYKQVSTELEQKIIALYAYGNSTLDIKEFIYETYGVEISPEFVSSVTDSISALADEWQKRPLQEIYTFAYLDAIHIKTRQEGRVVNKAVYIVLAYDLQGNKEILGHYVSSGGEGSKYWLSVVTDLKNRGVKDILIASVDGLNGFSEAIEAVFPNTVVQRCVIHAIRNSMRYIPHKHKAEFMADLKLVYKALTRAEAETNLEALVDKWSVKYPMATQVWVNNWEELSQYFNFTPEIRKLIYTTNAIESYNSILRKYTRNKKSFPNDESLMKILYIANCKATERWTKAIPDWEIILNQLSIYFEDRISLK